MTEIEPTVQGDRRPGGAAPGVVMLAFDGSPEAERALERCATLAGAFGARVLVVSVDSVRHHEAREEGASTLPLAEAGADRLRAQGVDAVARLGVGEPGRELARIANEERVDLVVVGGRSLTWLDRLIEGSVSDVLTHQTAADVLIVH